MTLIKPLLLSLCCGIFLVFTQARTADTIAANQQHYSEKILRELAGNVSFKAEGQHYRILTPAGDGGFIRRVVTREGYNGRIEFLVAHTPEGKILGARVTYHEETPGIGDKIDLSVSNWIRQFDGLTHQDTDWRLAPAGDIDGITGATVTATAAMKAISGAIQ